jgi:hypothetical protein
MDAEDEEAWAEARAALDRLPPEPPKERAHRERQQRRLHRLGVGLTAVAIVVMLVVLVVDRGSLRGGDRLPTWRTVAGLAVQLLGLVLMIGAAAVHGGAIRHTRGWRRPLDWLTRQERAQLLRQVRGKAPLERERLPLARHVARTHLVQRQTPAFLGGLLLSFTGPLIADPEIGRFLLLLLMAAAGVGALVHSSRESRRLQRFLDEHPDS